MNVLFIARIVFLILIILSCLTIYFLFGKGSYIEGLINNNTKVDFNDQGVPINPVLDEYGVPLTDGYYFVPSIPDGKYETGTKEYKKYIIKTVPYGFKASVDKKSISPVTDVAKLSDKLKVPQSDLPFWRELTFAEYSALPSIPIPNYTYSATNTGENQDPPMGYFKVKKLDGKYEVAKIPENHKLMNSGNPRKTYLSYTGEYSDIPNYNYSYNVTGTPDNTGEFELNRPNVILNPGINMYKIRLVEEYNPANDTEKKVKYVVATIPVGFKRDPSDLTFTKLINDPTQFNAAETDNLYDDDEDNDNVNAPQNAINTPEDETNDDALMQAGTYYHYDRDGKLVEINYKESNFAPVLYYMPGAYKFGTSNFVPTYEDSVYLSRTTREAQLLEGADPLLGVTNTDAQFGGFCSAYGNNKTTLDEKCAAVDPGSCASTTCCVLLGGQKCVGGNESGPYMTANYTDYMLRYKDFYYYQGKCYGNCKGNQGSP
jgi:hypothetical protein